MKSDGNEKGEERGREERVRVLPHLKQAVAAYVMRIEAVGAMDSVLTCV